MHFFTDLLDYEYHLNNDIALAHWKYYQSTANKTFLQEEAWPIMKGVSDFWASKVVRGQDGKYTASNMTGPVSFWLEYVQTTPAI